MPRKSTPDLPGDESEVDAPMTPDEATAELARLGQALIASAGSKQESKKATAELVGLLAKLKPGDFPDLADNPVVTQFLEQMASERASTSDDPPGTIYNAGTIAVYSKPWTLRDLKSPPADWRPGDAMPQGHCEWVHNYRPLKTASVTWNGLTVQFFARQPWTGPKCFAETLEISEEMEQAAHEHASYMFRNGGVPRDPGIVNEGTTRVRAHSSAGGPGTGFMPGAGVGPAFWAGMEAQADGESDEGEAA